MRQVPSATEIEEAVRRASSLPRVDPDTLGDDERRQPGPFGNNFYMLFSAMMLRPTKPDHTLVHTYLDRAEALGAPWQQFLSQNGPLLAALQEAVRDLDIYYDLKKIHRDLLFAQNFDGADAFDQTFHPTLGMDIISIPLWRRLNTLLEQAAAAMQRVGIDPKQFYG